jgi:hypothetical protein
MTEFCDMTTDELREAVAGEIYAFIMGQNLTPNTEEAQQQIAAHLSSYDTHFELVAHPQTEAEKAARYSGRMELRAKTAWGYVELLRRQAEEIETPYIISFDTEARH